VSALSLSIADVSFNIDRAATIPENSSRDFGTEIDTICHCGIDPLAESGRRVVSKPKIQGIPPETRRCGHT